MKMLDLDLDLAFEITRNFTSTQQFQPEFRDIFIGIF